MAKDYTSEPIKVFISYSHDSDLHSDLVLKLSNALREKAGIDSDIDQYHSNQDWPLWMEERLEWADVVLVICTETYLKRWKKEEPAGIGLGAKWESSLTRQQLYEVHGRNDKFIPVIFEVADVDFIPPSLRGVTRVHVGQDLENFENLIKRILNIPPAEKPPLRTSLAPIPRDKDFYAQLHGRDDAGLKSESLGLKDKSEQLFTNLFEVRFPDSIYQAESKIKEYKAFVREYESTHESLNIRSRAPLDYIFQHGRIYSFSNFNTPVWRKLQNKQIIWPKGKFDSCKWAESGVHSDKTNFIKLLNKALDDLCANNLTKYAITRSYKMDCHLFARKEGFREGLLNVKAIKSKAKRAVFKAIINNNPDYPSDIQHWKHVAFRHNFVRFGNNWYIVIKPFWAFTSDGVFTPSKWQKKSSFNMQKPERNRAVLGHVMFWASILCEKPGFFEAEDKFKILRPETFEASPSISDAEWINIDSGEDKQIFSNDLGLEL